MLKKIFWLLPAVVLAIGPVCLAGEQPGPARMLSRLPAAVQKSVHAQLGAGKLVAIAKNTDDDEVSYDVEMIRDGKDRSFTVAETGALLDLEVFLAELPAVVQKTIQTHVGQGTLGEIYRCIDDGETTYDAETTRDGKSRGFMVGADGELLDEEVFLAELPAAVQKTIQTEIGDGKLGEIDKSIDEGEITYDVEFTRSGKTRSITVGAAGELLETQMFLSELPAVLQKAIQAQLGSGKLGDVTKCMEDGEVGYDVEITQAGKTRTLTFGPDGTLTSEEEDLALAETPAAVRKQIQSLLGQGKLTGLTRTTENKKISYDAEVKQDGKTKSFSVDAEGKLLFADDGK
jgi:uncharacterized membrane protein YkoI